jgi:serine/threonine protein kinase
MSCTSSGADTVVENPQTYLWNAMKTPVPSTKFHLHRRIYVPKTIYFNQFIKEPLSWYFFHKFAFSQGHHRVLELLLLTHKYATSASHVWRARHIETVIYKCGGNGFVSNNPIKAELSQPPFDFLCSIRKYGHFRALSQLEADESFSRDVIFVVEGPVTISKDALTSLKQNENSTDAFDMIQKACLLYLRDNCWEAFQNYSEPFSRWCRFKSTVSVGLQLKIKDFQYICVLGDGGFGTVSAYVKRNTGQVYAGKRISKMRLCSNHLVHMAQEELTILSQIKSKFLVPAYFCFSDKYNIYFMTKLMTGGDLCSYLCNVRRFPEDEARYYIASVALGLDVLHQNGYCYRDLKPENVLLDEHGRARLCDFGLSCKFTDRKLSQRQVGTVGYVAPEVLRKTFWRFISPAVDYWSLGCLTFELLHGHGPPFILQAQPDTNKNRAVNYATLSHDVYYNPEIFNQDTKELCQKLLERDPDVRLSKIGLLKTQKWFQEFDWAGLIMGQLDPPKRLDGLGALVQLPDYYTKKLKLYPLCWSSAVLVEKYDWTYSDLEAYKYDFAAVDNYMDEDYFVSKPSFDVKKIFKSLFSCFRKKK